MQKYQIRDYQAKNQKSAPRMFDLIINEDEVSNKIKIQTEGLLLYMSVVLLSLNDTVNKNLFGV